MKTEIISVQTQIDDFGIPVVERQIRDMTPEEIVAHAANAPPLDLVAYAAQARWRKETGGIVVAGTAIATTERSRGLINGAYNLALAEPAAIIQFKGDGGFVDLAADTMIAIGLAVGRHVQACFAKEAEVLALITSGEITTPEQIDAQFA